MHTWCPVPRLGAPYSAPLHATHQEVVLALGAHGVASSSGSEEVSTPLVVSQHEVVHCDGLGLVEIVILGDALSRGL